MRQCLEHDFQILSVDSEQKILALLLSSTAYAIVEELSVAKDNHFNLAKALAKDDRHRSLPVLVFSWQAEDIAKAEACLEAGFCDVLLPPLAPSLLAKRIHNAARSRESFTFSEIEAILRELPSNIYLKDREGKYVFCTQYWHHLKAQVSAHWTIRGKTDLEVRKDKANALKAMASDQRILTSGEGETYLIEETQNGLHEYLELIKRPTHDENGKVNGIVALINNVTERQLLKIEMERRLTLDPLTGLLNKTATEELIGLALEKYSRSHQAGHGALLMIDVDDFKQVNDTFGHRMGDKVLISVASILHSSFHGVDVKGRVGGDEFMVFACDVSDAASAARLACDIGQKAKHLYDGSSLAGKLSLSIGISLYPQHGLSFKDLYKNADKALYDVKKQGKGSYALAQ
ncbi:MAG: GGDEF domain-containing protein [Desulfovibrio sp.]|nr:GGDEF domain-containing protein [Desulfovibrio sp.]